jgi:hypothetical protein
MTVQSSVEILFGEPTRDYHVLADIPVRKTRGLGCAVIENLMIAARIVRADAVLIRGRPSVEKLRCGPLRAYFLRWEIEIF